MENLKSALAWFDLIVSNRNEDQKNNIVEQFVQEVLDFSSQYGSDISVSYSALNLSGKPSIFPDYGDYPQACVTRTYGRWWDEAPSRSEDFQPQNNGAVSSTDFIEVQFKRAVYPTGIRIYETYNPGAVVRIWARTREGWVNLWEGPPQVVGHTSRLFQPKLRKIKLETCILRLELNQTHLPYYTELDAVLLEGTLKLYNKDLDVYSKREDLTKISSEINHGSVESLERDLTSRIIALGLHIDLITEFDKIQDIFNEDFCKLFSNDSACMGNFRYLPDETVLKIFSFLDLKSLCRCAQVSKNFNRLARDPALYKSLNLKPYWHCVDEYVLKTLSSRAALLQKLDLSWCGNHEVFDKFAFSQLIQCRGSTLTHLRLNSCDFVDCLAMRCIAEYCCNLRELSMRSCGVVSSGFVYLSSLRNLTRLDLYRTLIDKTPLIAIIRSNPNLEHINLGACGYIFSMDDVVMEIGRCCRNLISIDLWKTYSLTQVGIRALLNCTKLQEVDFGWCLQVGGSGEWVGELAKACPGLRKLFLGALRAISDRDLRPVVSLCPNLEQLDLFGVRAITADICELILAECPNLKLMDISFCDQILESQVRRWRERFPWVSIKRTFTCEDRQRTFHTISFPY